MGGTSRSRRSVLEIAAAPFDNNPDDLSGRFRELIDVLPRDDGVRRFCQVHEIMSNAVAKRHAEGEFRDTEGLARMDVLLVKRFFDQVVLWETEPRSISKAWRPLFEKRGDRTTHPIRFAVAGIHAHVASDLLWAVLETHKERGVDPELGSELHKDYCEINDIELGLRDQVEDLLGTETSKDLDAWLGRWDDVLRSWSFARARDKCWLDACVIARLPNPLDDLHYSLIEKATGLTNRAFLV